MNVYKVSKELEDKYHGAGYAIGCIDIKSKKLIDFAYCQDIESEFNIHCMNANRKYKSKDLIYDFLISNEKIEQTVLAYEVDGVSRAIVGLLSSHDFIEV